MGDGPEQRPVVLLADDDPEVRSLLASELRAEGLAVVEVEDGRALVNAVDELREGHGPRLIVADHRMPGWTGLQVLAGLRAAHIDVPLVLMTAFGDDWTHAEATRLGAAAVFDKPFPTARLRACVCALLGRESTAT
jgi:DNA-binding response OmpR family regulator